jgi:hypothetical protein
VTVEHLNDDYGITARKVSWLAAQLDMLAPGWAEYVNPSLFEQREIASSALGQVREHLADRGDPKWRDVTELQWGNFPMKPEWWSLWHAAWQTETLKRVTPDDHAPHAAGRGRVTASGEGIDLPARGRRDSEE